MVITLSDALTQHDDLIDSLVFKNYVHNRERSPNITPEQWEIVYGAKVYEYEKILFLEETLERISKEVKEMTTSLHMKCIKEKHDSYLDRFASENCREDVYYCKTCKRIYIERWEGDEYLTVHVLPLGTPKKEISELLTWLE